MKKLVVIISPLLLVFMVLVVLSRQVLAEELNYKIMAGFVYAVPGLMLGDGAKKRVCYYGYDQLTLALEDKYDDVIALKDFRKVAISGCKVLYIAKDKDRKLKDIIRITDQARIVTIGLSDDFVDNGGIMILQMGRRSVELIANHSKIKSMGIKFDPMVSGLIIN